MRLARRSREERETLLVPVLPGTVIRGTTVPPPGHASRRWLLPAAIAAVVVAGIVVAVVLLARGPGAKKVATIPSPAARPVPTVQAPAKAAPKPVPKPTAAERAHAAAVKLAATLPVSLETAAVFRQGPSVYVIGGNRRGRPTDLIWRIDVKSRRASAAGRFIEPLADAASAAHGGALYIAGGWTGEKVATAVLRWTPGSDPALVARLPAGVRGARAAFAGGKLYVVGGTPKASYAVDVEARSVAPAGAIPAGLRASVARPNLATLTSALLGAAR